MSDYKPGMRVHVTSGDGCRVLGTGTYLGEADVWCAILPDGSLHSMSDAETQKPDEALLPTGSMIRQIGKNPKIRLDSGQIVYGCQVWWSPLVEDKGNEQAN